MASRIAEVIFGTAFLAAGVIVVGLTWQLHLMAHDMYLDACATYVRDVARLNDGPVKTEHLRSSEYLRCAN